LSWSLDISSRRWHFRLQNEEQRSRAPVRNEEGPVRNRLKVLRAERDWSQAELGGRLGVSRQAVNAIETGKYDPSLPLAFKLARLFEMRIEDIFQDEGAAQ
jgi:putative transcriptional regulator